MVAWCLAGLLVIQVDREQLTYGLLIHIFGHLCLLSLLVWQLRQFHAQRKTERSGHTA